MIENLFEPFNCECGGIIGWAKAGSNRKIRSKRKQ
jgi:hypothetical protein